MSEENNTIDQSRLRDNTYTHFCDFHGQRRYYAVCLHLIDAVKEGRLKEDGSGTDCNTAICRGSCQAIKMRQNETEKGESLYYVKRAGTVDRPKKQEQESPSTFSRAGYERGWALAGRVIKGEPERPAEPKKRSIFDAKAIDLAGVVNEAIKKEESKKISLLEFRRRVDQAKMLVRSADADLREMGKQLAAELKVIREGNLIEMPGSK